MEEKLHRLSGVILVGGPSVGTRFRPLSMTLPKPLFPIAGSPMIYHHVSALAKLPGMKEILVMGFFDPIIFTPFLNKVESEFPTISIREYQALGTAGCLFHFRDEILRGNPSKIFVMNADIASSFPLDKMLQFHLAENTGAISTLLSIRIDRKDVHKYGCVVTNNENQVLHFVEKPETFISDLISCGVYLFDNKIFQIIKFVIEQKRNTLMENNILDVKDQRTRLEQDVLTYLASQNQLYTFILDGEIDFWRQIKTGSSAIPANGLYLQHFRKTQPRILSATINSPILLETSLKPLDQQPRLIQPVIIHPTAIIHSTAKIGPNVMIGPKVQIGKGSRIKNSIILDSVTVDHDACILNSIVGWESKIGCWARVEGSPEDATHLNATYKGLKIPTATVLGQDVVVSDEIVVRNCIVLPHKELRYSFQNEVIM